jgi:hypothetical protein
MAPTEATALDNEAGADDPLPGDGETVALVPRVEPAATVTLADWDDFGAAAELEVGAKVTVASKLELGAVVDRVSRVAAPSPPHAVSRKPAQPQGKPFIRQYLANMLPFCGDIARP